MPLDKSQSTAALGSGHDTVHEGRVTFEGDGDALKGRVRWDPLKSLWWIAMATLWIGFGFTHFSISAVVVCGLLTALTLWVGQSLGLHRMLIHQAFDGYRSLRLLLVYLGTLVGLGGPIAMTRTHELRDWAQNQGTCHPYLSNGAHFLKDLFWQVHCRLELDQPPTMILPKDIERDPALRFLEMTARWQQLPLAILLYSIGGIGWVAWGIGARICISSIGHWGTVWLAHNRGTRDWYVLGAGTQGHNLRGLGLVTFGEGWHSNHHAFPRSARMGLGSSQIDPSWTILRALQRLGLRRDVQTPDTLPKRDRA
ncbi:MAG: acyl-CoA desaturase [Pseudomonadota bacterium]